MLHRIAPAFVAFLAGGGALAGLPAELAGTYSVYPGHCEAPRITLDVEMIALEPRDGIEFQVDELAFDFAADVLTIEGRLAGERSVAIAYSVADGLRAEREGSSFGHDDLDRAFLTSQLWQRCE